MVPPNSGCGWDTTAAMLGVTAAGVHSTASSFPAGPDKKKFLDSCVELICGHDSLHESRPALASLLQPAFFRTVTYINSFPGSISIPVTRVSHSPSPPHGASRPDANEINKRCPRAYSRFVKNFNLSGCTSTVI